MTKLLQWFLAIVSKQEVQCTYAINISHRGEKKLRKTDLCNRIFCSY